MKHPFVFSPRRCGVAGLSVISLWALSTGLSAQEDAGNVPQMEEVQVLADWMMPGVVEGPFLPDIEGTRINAGKKTSNMLLHELPTINNDNYRQLIAQTPGLVLSEESTPLVSIGFRGFEPHRMQFFQVLQNGFPIHADMFGYPEAYYTPTFQAVERVELVRGGAALQYGPQPAGALNFVMKTPPLDRPFALESINTLGSFGFYSNYTALGGTIGNFTYGGYYNHRQADGFREANSYYYLNNYSGTFALDANGPRRWFLYLDAYDESHGEPGGLTLATGPNTVNYNTDRNGTSRFFDRMRISRYAVSLLHENELSEDTLLTVRGWWNYYLRASWRQRGGGFGTLPTGPDAQTNSIENQQFYTFGIEPRILHNYEWLGEEHAFSGGMMLYQTWSPRVDSRGSTPGAVTGTIRNQSERQNWYYSVFAENLFRIGNLSITPGVRLESIWQSVSESINVGRTNAGLPLQNESNFTFVPLFGLGLEYAFTPQIQAYANVSTAYRPVIFSQAVPSSPTEVVAGNLDPSYIWNYEAGFRGSPAEWIVWDTSFFLVDFQNQIGSRTADGGNLTIIENAGRSVTYGWDASLQLDFTGIAEELFRPEIEPVTSGKNPAAAPAPESWVERYGSLGLFTNLTLMQADFISGPNTGKTPQYTPDYLFRVGLTYDWQERIKIGFLGNFSGASFADSSNTPSRFIPAYDVWDLTIEAKVFQDWVTVIAGVNNIFDRNYYSRIRSDGIDPAAPRNWYAGVKVEF